MPWRSVTVTTEPTQLAAYRADRPALTLFNNGAADLFFSGDPANLLAEGFVLKPSAAASLHRALGDNPEEALFGQVAAGTLDVRVQESVGEPRRPAAMPGA